MKDKNRKSIVTYFILFEENVKISLYKAVITYLARNMSIRVTAKGNHGPRNRLEFFDDVEGDVIPGMTYGYC